jgi:hypothetical protein
MLSELRVLEAEGPEGKHCEADESFKTSNDHTESPRRQARRRLWGPSDAKDGGEEFRGGKGEAGKRVGVSLRVDSLPESQ